MKIIVEFSSGELPAGAIVSFSLYTLRFFSLLFSPVGWSVSPEAVKHEWICICVRGACAQGNELARM